MKKILSIDGGGVRDLIPALILVEIEKRIQKPLHEVFDLMAGTSAGAVLILGLTKPLKNGKAKFTAKDMTRFYEFDGKTTFHQSWLEKITNPGSLLKSKYSRRGVEEVLTDYFEDSRLSDCLTNVLVTSYETERRSAWFFTSHDVTPENDFYIRDVAYASSAAPTFFKPYKLKTETTEDYYSFIDGAVFANNPAMCAYTEARTIFPGEEKFLLISLGTGEITKPIPYQVAEKWGLAGWAPSLFDIITDGINDTVDYQLTKLTADEKCGRYFRIQANLFEECQELDNSTDENVRQLRLAAEDTIRKHDREINKICELLLA